MFFNHVLYSSCCQTPPLREINKAFVLIVKEFRIESHLVNDCLTAGVIKILRSLFPFPMVDSISELT
ncbi:MAG: hypothetical protein K0S76_350 [Herbinix sp.]|jgi:hypothetical protein|nr:hypothetical protein [Herbinix sp.]